MKINSKQFLYGLGVVLLAYLFPSTQHWVIGKILEIDAQVLLLNTSGLFFALGHCYRDGAAFNPAKAINKFVTVLSVVSGIFVGMVLVAAVNKDIPNLSFWIIYILEVLFLLHQGQQICLAVSQDSPAGQTDCCSRKCKLWAFMLLGSIALIAAILN